MIHNKIHLISPGCPRPNISLQVQNRDLEHQPFHFSSPGCPQPSISLQVQNRGLQHHSFLKFSVNIFSNWFCKWYQYSAIGNLYTGEWGFVCTFPAVKISKFIKYIYFISTSFKCIVHVPFLNYHLLANVHILVIWINMFMYFGYFPCYKWSYSYRSKERKIYFGLLLSWWSSLLLL